MLLALTGAAGSLDAIGFLALGHLFTANMTGNIVLLGLHVAQEQGVAAVRSVIALLGFGVGLVIGALIAERSADQRRGPRPSRKPWRSKCSSSPSSPSDPTSPPSSGKPGKRSR